MATLSAEVQTRIAASFLLELTNQGSTTASTVNTTVLDAAVADATGEFLTETGLALDTTLQQHVAAGVVGVMFYLYTYVGVDTSATERMQSRWWGWLAKISTTEGGNARLLPDTTSTLTPTAEVSGTRPDNERSRWQDFTLNMPSGGSTDEDLGDVMDP